MVDRDSFDLFALLGALNRRDIQAFDKLTEEGQKAAHPLVIMRWLSGTGDAAQIIRLNEFANRYVFSLGTEKPLLFKLLAAACTGKTQRTNWIKGPGQKSNRLAIKAICAGYDVSSREAEGYIGLLDAADIVRCAEDAGWEKDDMKRLTTELEKDDTGPTRAQKSRSIKKK